VDNLEHPTSKIESQQYKFAIGSPLQGNTTLWDDVLSKTCFHITTSYPLFDTHSGKKL